MPAAAHTTASSPMSTNLILYLVVPGTNIFGKFTTSAFHTPTKRSYYLMTTLSPLSVRSSTIQTYSAERLLRWQVSVHPNRTYLWWQDKPAKFQTICYSSDGFGHRAQPEWQECHPQLTTTTWTQFSLLHHHLMMSVSFLLPQQYQQRCPWCKW
jgi:hypothetical protein